MGGYRLKKHDRVRVFNGVDEDGVSKVEGNSLGHSGTSMCDVLAAARSLGLLGEEVKP